MDFPSFNEFIASVEQGDYQSFATPRDGAVFTFSLKEDCSHADLVKLIEEHGNRIHRETASWAMNLLQAYHDWLKDFFLALP